MEPAFDLRSALRWAFAAGEEGVAAHMVGWQGRMQEPGRDVKDGRQVPDVYEASYLVIDRK